MRFKEHWLIGDDDLRKRVAIPEYIADAMADAISSKGVDSTVSFHQLQKWRSFWSKPSHPPL